MSAPSRVSAPARLALGLALLAVSGCATATATVPRPRTFALDANVAEIVGRGEGRAALAAYESQARELERAGGAGFDAVRAHVAAARTADLLGAYDAGTRHAERALRLLEPPSQSLSGLLLAIHARLVLGRIRLQLNDLDGAEREFDALLALAPRAPVQPGRLAVEALAQVNLAAIAELRGQRERAIAVGGAAARAGEELLTRYGTVGSAGAGRVVAEARDLVGADMSRAYITVGRVELESRRLADAERSFRRAEQYAALTQSPQFAIAVRFYLSDVAYRRGDGARAEREAEAALADAKRADLADVATVIHVRLAERADAGGAHAQALAHYDSALRLVEDLRAQLAGAGARGLFVENKQEVYNGAVRAALALGRDGDAFTYAERGRARAFLDMLGTRTVVSRAKAPPRAAEEAQVRTRLADAGAASSAAAVAGSGAEGLRGATERRDVAVGEYRAFVDGVRADDREQASLMTVEPVTLAEVQGLLPEDTTLLEYLVTESETVVWIVDRRGVRVLRLPVGRTVLIAEVRELRRAINDHAALADVQDRARRLYDRVLAPVRPHVAGRRLLIAPHDVLHYVPYAALWTGGRWLVEEHALATVPSASTLRFLKDKGRAGAAGVLVVGNPDIGAEGALPFAEQEARVVAESYPGSTLLLRREATEARVKRASAGARLIHFATHAVLREDDPLASALLLAPGDGEDGRLEVREIFGLALDAELVVLSACETGLGRLSRGDELLGLQRAFVYAGTPAVVTTLWKVDDRASFRVMRLFHERLAADGATRALQAAQQQGLREFPHPFFWAAFGLTGGGAR
ncbi:MAG: CHAT domain-containing protein [Candidatus Rokuibacteriota bacterium]